MNCPSRFSLIWARLKKRPSVVVCIVARQDKTTKTNLRILWIGVMYKGSYGCKVFYNVVAVGSQQGAVPSGLFSGPYNRLFLHKNLPQLLSAYKFYIMVAVSWQRGQVTMHPHWILKKSRDSLTRKVQWEHSLTLCTLFSCRTKKSIGQSITKPGVMFYQGLAQIWQSYSAHGFICLK